MLRPFHQRIQKRCEYQKAIIVARQVYRRRIPWSVLFLVRASGFERVILCAHRGENGFLVMRTECGAVPYAASDWFLDD